MINRFTKLLAIFSVATLMAAAAGAQPSSAGNGGGQTPGRGPGPGPTAGPDAEEGPRARECSVPGLLLDLPVEGLSVRELRDLAFVREEEKLSRDTYLSIYETWDLRVFRKIARAEKKHIQAVLVLFDKYELADPSEGNPIGVFEDPNLQALYEDLVELGSLSRLDAYLVGAMVEELGIHDLLTEALANADNADLRTLYQNLAKGSRNHLRAFDKILRKRGVVYEPEHLSLGTYEEIVTSPVEKGVVDENGEWICGGSKKGHFE